MKRVGTEMLDKAMIAKLVGFGVVAGLAASLSAQTGRAAEPVFDCVMDPALLVKVGSPVIGLLEKVLVRRGDLVKRRQMIARIESRVEAATVELNRVRAKGTAQIDAQKVRLKFSRKQLERATKLLERKVVSAQRFDDLRAKVEVGESELARVKMQRRLAQLELARSQRVLEQRVIRSPIDGVVTERPLSAGEFVHQEAHIVTLAMLNPLHVETFLPVKFHGQIKMGMTATVVPDAPVRGSYPAKVTVVDSVFDSASGTFGVRLALNNPGNRLPAGHRCKVTFPISPVIGRVGGG